MTHGDAITGEPMPESEHWWLAEATAEGDAGAVRLMVKLKSEPGGNLLAALRAEVEGSYRRRFQEWSRGPRSRAARLTSPLDR